MPVREEEVSQERRVGERLDDAVHEACVSEVDQPSQAWEGGRQESGGAPRTDLPVLLGPNGITVVPLHLCVHFLFSHSFKKKKEET